MRRRLGDRMVELDNEGYLVSPDDWGQDIAIAMAEADGLRLVEDHWAVIALLRDYWYCSFVSPPLRILVKIASARPGLIDGGTPQLYRLFPGGPAKQGCRYAGLPKPRGCV